MITKFDAIVIGTGQAASDGALRTRPPAQHHRRARSCAHADVRAIFDKSER